MKLWPGAGTTDKHAIFHELTKRNALRKAARLPLLDLHKEFAYAVRREEVRAYYEYRSARYGADEERILKTVLEEYRGGRPIRVKVHGKECLLGPLSQFSAQM